MRNARIAAGGGCGGMVMRPTSRLTADGAISGGQLTSAVKAFLRRTRETVQLYQPLSIVTDKAQSCGKVVGEIIDRRDPEHAIRHISRKYLNNRTESDLAALKRFTRPMRSFRSLSSAKASLRGTKSECKTRSRIRQPTLPRGRLIQAKRPGIGLWRLAQQTR